MKCRTPLRFLIRLIGTLGFVLVPLMAGASEPERIEFFDSYIQVHSDNRLNVTETIEVYAARKKIEHGIYRDFPTRYQDRRGKTRQVGFEVLEALRNGEPEPYHFGRLSNGTRLYIGHKNRRLPSGPHTYTIHYQTDRQIGFFKDFDELYWNVTGNGWAFPIVQAQAVVELPAGAEVVEFAAYTGRQGARGRNFSVDNDELGNIRFRTQRTLKPAEGLTIAVAWPKGFIKEPTLTDSVGFFLHDNPGSLIAFLGVVILAGYFLIAWFKVGRDPAKGPIIPLFKPPKGFTPAAVRFVTKMAFDHKAFAAAIVNMAVKGYLTINENDGDYTLSKTAGDQALLSAGEKRIARQLFGQSRQITLDKSRHSRIKKALTALKTSLKLDFEKLYFQRNAKWLIPGFVISLATLTAVIFNARDMGGALFMLVWLSGWTVGCFALVAGAIGAWHSALSTRSSNGLFKKTGAVGMTLFALPFVGFEFFGLWAFTGMTSPMATAALLIIIFINFIFYQLMKAPTLYGRRVMDHIEGFKRYLSVAEKEGLNRRNPPEKTPALFEKFLPYALALDVENEWTEQFAEVLAQAQIKDEYTPGWYSGRSWHGTGFSGLAASLGSSLAATISSSSSPPGSSSGSGGGGSSGGGGGGGGVSTFPPIWASA